MTFIKSLSFSRKLAPALMICLAVSACKSDEERAEDAYQRGMALIEAGDPARARVEFRNAVAADVNHVGTQIELGRLNLREGKAIAAYKNFARVYEVDPENLEAVTSIARIAFGQQDWESFERYGARAVELAPEDAGVRVIDLVRKYRQAMLDRKEDDREALLARAEALSDEVQDDMMLRLIRIDAYVGQERHDEALAQLAAAIADDPTSAQYHGMKLQVLDRLRDIEGIEAELRRMAEAVPDEKAYKVVLLRFLVARGELDEAEAVLRDEIDRIAAEGPETDDSKGTARTEARTVATIDLVQFLKLYRGSDTALAELDGILAADPAAHRFRALRAALIYEIGRRDEAIAEMEGLVALEESSLKAEERQNLKVMLAGMLTQAGNEVGARRLVEEVLQADPINAEALKIKAGWLIAEDKSAEAVTALRTALATSPEDTAAMRLMAQAHERAGNRDLMLESLSLAVEASKNAPDESLLYARALMREKRFDQADSVLVAALRLVPGHVTLLNELGLVQLSRNNPPLVRQTIGQLRALGSEQALRAAAELELRLIEREQGTEEALAYLGSLAGSDEDDRVKLALIRAQLVSGKTQEALDYANELVAAKPDQFSYRYFRALALAASQDHAGAAEALTELAREKPDQPQLWLQLARIRGITGSETAMMATLDEGLKAIPDSPDILWARASILERQGDVDGAIAIYERLYERDSSSVVVANNLASMLATYRDDAESLARAETIARRLKGSDLPALQDTYGWILFRTGKAQEALGYLEPAARGLAGDATVQVHLGMVYQALGRTEEARARLDLARTAAGPSPGRNLAERIMALEAALTQ